MGDCYSDEINTAKLSVTRNLAQYIKSKFVIAGEFSSFTS